VLVMVGRDELQCDWAAELRVPRPIHLAHAAAATRAGF
jgi:hypothetical protein